MIWNRTRSLAETAVPDKVRQAALAKREANRIDRERKKDERRQLNWKPEPARAPYAGRE